MMRLCRWSAIWAAAAILTTGICQAQGPLVLEYKFTQGQTLNYLFSLEGEATTSVEQAPLPPIQTTMQGRIDCVQRIGEVYDDASARVEMSCPGMVLNMNTAGQSISILWENGKLSLMVNGQAQPAPEGMDFSKIPFLGAPLKLRIDRLGRVVEMQPADLGVLQGMVGNLNFSELLKASQNQLPDHPVGVGESWTAEVKVALPGTDQSLTANALYTLAGIETLNGQEVARIAMNGSVQAANLKFAAPTPEGAPAEVVIEELKQDAQGTIWFATQLGQPVKNELSMTMHEVISAPSPMGPQKVSVDMKMNMTMSLK